MSLLKSVDKNNHSHNPFVNPFNEVEDYRELFRELTNTLHFLSGKLNSLNLSARAPPASLV
jgi:hypothetical protein